MKPWLLAWWFVYSLLGAEGQLTHVALAGPFDTDVACQRVREDLIGRLQRPGLHFTVEQCQPDRVDKTPR